MFLRAAAFWTFLCGAAIAAGVGGARTPVIVELFTSEGCSSCPPADALLERLQRTQPVAGARVIALAEHVDYWNSLGWVDPFSSPQFRGRQNEFAQVFRLDSIYTPEMVVNGRVEFTGDDMGRALAEIGRAAAQPAANVTIASAVDSKDPAALDITVQVRDLPSLKKPVDVYLAITEDNLVSSVQRGENAGRRLRHTGVVRSFGVIGTITPESNPRVSWSLHPAVKFPAAWKQQDLRAVVFLQDRGTHAIVGAAELVAGQR